tara:strand:+ start:1200 stop:1883 length:684 start_codon:yes stop_codon:yes gene_type:complete
MTKVYLASPSNQLHATMLSGMNVLLSFGSYEKFLKSYVQSFGSVLLDSGAFGAFNSGKTIDVLEYIDWVQMFPEIDAYAGLDDISGDWRKSLSNYKHGGFPTIHDSDPTELLDDLIPMARERGGWIGVGLVPPRSGKGEFLRRTLERIPDDIHVHGFALREYRRSHRFGSVDSTNWFRDSFGIRKRLPWLTPAECLEIVIKRERRELIMHREEVDQMSLFEGQVSNG